MDQVSYGRVSRLHIYLSTSKSSRLTDRAMSLTTANHIFTDIDYCLHGYTRAFLQAASAKPSLKSTTNKNLLRGVCSL